METRTLKRLAGFEEKPLMQTEARKNQVSEICETPGTVFKDELGRVLFIFGSLEGDFSDLKAHMKKIRYNHTSRITASDKNFSDRQFGYRLTRAVRQNSAGGCALNYEKPEVFSELTTLGNQLKEKYRDHAPRRFARHNILAGQIKHNWFIGETFFNQGIINKSAQLDYHYDRDNFDGVFSCMGVFRKLSTGGELIVPAYDIGFSMPDKSYLIFDGQAIMHGVAPIHNAPNGYRFSVVYYSFKKFINAGSFEEEFTKFKQSMNTNVENRLKDVKEIRE